MTSVIAEKEHGQTYYADERHYENKPVRFCCGEVDPKYQQDNERYPPEHAEEPASFTISPDLSLFRKHHHYNLEHIG